MMKYKKIHINARDEVLRKIDLLNRSTKRLESMILMDRSVATLRILRREVWIHWKRSTELLVMLYWRKRHDL